MALQGSASAQIDTGHSLTLTWQQTPLPSEGRSEVTVRFYYVLQEGAKLQVDARNYHNTIAFGDSSVSFKVPAIKETGPAEILLHQCTQSVPHLSDGTCTFTLQGRYYLDSDIGVRHHLWVKISAEVTLDSLFSPSTLSSCPQQVVLDGETPVSIAVTRSHTDFYHVFRLVLGDFALETPPFEDAASFVIPMEWLSAFPSAPKAEALGFLSTFLNSACETLAGPPETVTLTLAAPASLSPQLSPGWVCFSPLQPQNAQLPEDSSLFIQDLSRIRVAFRPGLIDVSHLFGAALSSFHVSAADFEAETSAEAEDPSCTLGPFPLSGPMTLRVRACDTRGHESAETFSISILPYAPPALYEASVFRCNALGEADEEGTSLRFFARAQFSALNGFNRVTLTARYRPTGGEWGQAHAMEAGQPLLLGGNLDPAASYESEILLSDAMGSQSSYRCVIPTRSVTLHIPPGGRALGLGKYARGDEMLDCAWPIFTPCLQAAEKIIAPSLEIPASALWEDVPVSPLASGASVSVTARACALLSIALLSGTCTLSSSLSPGESLTLAALSSHLPQNDAYVPLSCSGAQGAQAALSPAGSLILFSCGAEIPANTPFFFSGLYFSSQQNPPQEVLS